MSSPNFNRTVNWQKVLEELGIVVDQVLPCSFNCPNGTCRGTMRGLPDVPAGGAWFFCKTCKFSGYTVELAANLWKLDIPTTLRKLAALNISLEPNALTADAIATYNRVYIAAKEATSALWLKARRRLLSDDSKDVRYLQHKLGLRADLEKIRWLEGPGQFVGATHKDDLNDLKNIFASGNSPETYDGKFTETHRLGNSWGDIIIVPMHDLPGRIRNFMCIGRSGNMVKDVFDYVVGYGSGGVRYSGLSNMTRLSTTRREAGLALYSALDYLQSTLFVTNDILSAIRFQVVHARTRSDQLPLVGIHSGVRCETSPNVWESIPENKIFWGRPNSLLFRHARATNGRISIAGFTEAGPIRDAYKTPLSEWLERAEKYSRPWDEALEILLHKLPLPRAESLLLGMQLTYEELKEYMELCPDELKNKLQSGHREKRIKRVAYGRNTVIEDEEGWIAAQTGARICNAKLKLDKVIYHRARKKAYYAGKIIQKDKELPFLVNVMKVRRSTFLWMRDKMITAGMDYFVYDGSWETSALSIAATLHKPLVCKGYDSIGWNEDDACLVFRDFLITSGGNVVDNHGYPLVPIKAGILRMEKPKPFTNEQIQELISLQQADIFWSLAAVVSANLLAPIFNLCPTPTVLAGEAANDLGRTWARLLGCYEIVIKRADGKGNADDFKVINSNPYSTMLLQPGSLLPEYRYDGLQHKNLILPANWYTARSIAMRGTHNVIMLEDSMISPAVLSAMPLVIPNFLQYAALQRFKLPEIIDKKRNIGFATKILMWMSDWFTEISNDKEAVLPALKTLRSAGELPNDYTPADMFLEIVCRMFYEGLVNTSIGIPATKAKNFKTLIFLDGENGQPDGLFISSAVLGRAMFYKGSMALDKNIITDALRARGWLLDEMEYRGLSGWLIPAIVWKSHYDAWAKVNGGKVRVNQIVLVTPKLKEEPKWPQPQPS